MIIGKIIGGFFKLVLGAAILIVILILLLANLVRGNNSTTTQTSYVYEPREDIRTEIIYREMDPRLRAIDREYQNRAQYSIGSYLTCPICGRNYYKGYNFYTGYRNPATRDDNLCSKECEDIYWGLVAADKSGDRAEFERLIQRKNSLSYGRYNYAY